MFAARDFFGFGGVASPQHHNSSHLESS